MRNRVIFPIEDEHGVARGFAGRLLSGDGPKYLNTPETTLYQKRSLLYGLHLARQPIIEAGTAVVVEGYTDAIAVHQAGITNVVATAGTALTSEHLGSLAQITRKVTLAFDGDEAGLLAVDRVAELDRGQPDLGLFVARLPEGQDPASLLIDSTTLPLENIIAQAVPIEHHSIDQILLRHSLEEPEAMARAIHAAGEVIRRVGDPNI
ncbi:MAG: toprim domain-containing protein, partial [Acidimicrobiia bacterium]|nr:toprim domain-containing protein [Acidimicrobiia bacterium]